MRLGQLAFLALLLPLTTTACGGDDDPTGPSDSIYGTYALETVQGQALPAIILQVGNDLLEATAGSARLNSDNTWSASITLRLTEAGVVTTSTEGSSGTFTINNNTLQLTDPSDGSVVTGSVSGNVLTVIEDNVSFVFRK